jgi:hypothetical protein
MLLRSPGKNSLNSQNFQIVWSECLFTFEFGPQQKKQRIKVRRGSGVSLGRLSTHTAICTGAFARLFVAICLFGLATLLSDAPIIRRPFDRVFACLYRISLNAPPGQSLLKKEVMAESVPVAGLETLGLMGVTARARGPAQRIVQRFASVMLHIIVRLTLSIIRLNQGRSLVHLKREAKTEAKVGNRSPSRLVARSLVALWVAEPAIKSLAASEAIIPSSLMCFTDIYHTQDLR